MWERWTICLLRGQKWTKVAYDAHDDSGFFRCRVCGHVNHGGTSVRPTFG
jgi:hypothetical protein